MLPVANGCTAIAVVRTQSEAAAVAGYDENPYLPVVHQATNVRRQTGLRKDAVQWRHPRPQRAINAGFVRIFLRRFHVLRGRSLFPPKRGTLIAFSQSPRNGLRDNPLATPSGCPASNLKTVCGHPGKPFFIPTYYAPSPTNARHDEYRSSKQRNSRRAASPPVEKVLGGRGGVCRRGTLSKGSLPLPNLKKKSNSFQWTGGNA